MSAVLRSSTFVDPAGLRARAPGTDKCFSIKSGAFLVFVSAMMISPVWAQETAYSQAAAAPKFALSVSVQDSLQKPEMPRAAARPDLSQEAALPPEVTPVMIPRAAVQRQAVPMQAKEDERPNSYLEEYKVNWAPWMNHLAGEWHGILKDAEACLGAQFQTPRPALIQFTCYADGRIGNVILRQSSGVPVYDRLQIAALMESAPLPPFPPGTAKHSVTLIQGWESHFKQPGEEDFDPRNFASRYPQEKVSRWVSSQ